MWHSKWMVARCSRDLTSSLINQEMTEIGQAAWLCGSLPLGCIIAYLEKFLFVLKSMFRCCPLSGDGCWSQPLVIYIRYTQAKWVVGHVRAGLQEVLVEPSVFVSRDTLSEGGPIPCQVGIQFPISACGFWLYTIYVEREMQAFY